MMEMFDIKGQKAIVTGGTRGLGYGMAEGLLEAGAKVVIFGSSAKVEDVAADFRDKGYDCQGLKVELSNAAERVSGFEKAVELLGGLDILVNAAGINLRYECDVYPIDEWNNVMEVNLTAPFVLCQMALKEFMKKENPYGKIINVASMLSFFGGSGVPAYSASKGGIVQFTKTMCNDFADKNIAINCVAPGYMLTDMNVNLARPEHPKYQGITDRIPAKRWGTPDDMKGITVFLASHASDYLNGAIIPVDGGYMVR